MTIGGLELLGSRGVVREISRVLHWQTEHVRSRKDKKCWKHYRLGINIFRNVVLFKLDIRSPPLEEIYGGGGSYYKDG